MSLGILIVVGCIELGVLAYALRRTDWVFEQRMRLIDEDFNAYRRLPSYDKMLRGHGFWRWDINYYLRKK